MESDNNRPININNYNFSEGKLCASIKWIIMRIYESNDLPDNLRDLFYRDDQGSLQLRCAVAKCLTSGTFYTQAAAKILRNNALVTQSVGAILRALSAVGVDAREPGGAHVTEAALLTDNPLNIISHLALIDALMVAHLRSVISIERVIQAVSAYTPVEKREEPLDCVDALLFWINKICLLVRDDVERSEIVLGAGDATVPEMEDLYEDLCDGTCVCALVSFYHPHEMPLQRIYFNDPMHINDCRFNLGLLKEFCESVLPYSPFHFEVEDILYLHESLQANVNVFLADLFNFFEIGANNNQIGGLLEQNAQNFATTQSSSMPPQRRFATDSAPVIPDLRGGGGVGAAPALAAKLVNRLTAPKSYYQQDRMNSMASVDSLMTNRSRDSLMFPAAKPPPTHNFGSNVTNFGELQKNADSGDAPTATTPTAGINTSGGSASAAKFSAVEAKLQMGELRRQYETTKLMQNATNEEKRNKASKDVFFRVMSKSTNEDNPSATGGESARDNATLGGLSRENTLNAQLHSLQEQINNIKLNSPNSIGAGGQSQPITAQFGSSPSAFSTSVRSPQQFHAINSAQLHSSGSMDHQVSPYATPQSNPPGQFLMGNAPNFAANSYQNISGYFAGMPPNQYAHIQHASSQHNISMQYAQQQQQQHHHQQQQPGFMNPPQAQQYYGNAAPTQTLCYLSQSAQPHQPQQQQQLAAQSSYFMNASSGYNNAQPSSQPPIQQQHQPMMMMNMGCSQFVGGHSTPHYISPMLDAGGGQIHSQSYTSLQQQQQQQSIGYSEITSPTQHQQPTMYSGDPTMPGMLPYGNSGVGGPYVGGQMPLVQSSLYEPNNNNESAKGIVTFRLHQPNASTSRLDPPLELNRNLTNWGLTYRVGERVPRKSWSKSAFRSEHDVSQAAQLASSVAGNGNAGSGRGDGEWTGTSSANNGQQHGSGGGGGETPRGMSNSSSMGGYGNGLVDEASRPQLQGPSETPSRNHSVDYGSGEPRMRASRAPHASADRRPVSAFITEGGSGATAEDGVDPEMTAEMQAKRRALLLSQMRRKEKMAVQNEEKELELTEKRHAEQQKLEQAEQRKLERELKRQRLLEDYKRKKMEADLGDPTAGSIGGSVSARMSASSTTSLNRGHSQPPIGRPKSQSNMSLAVSRTLQRSGRTHSNMDENSTPRVLVPSIAEPALKLYAKHQPKSNRGLMMNALQYRIFPGAVSVEQKNRVQCALAQSDSKHFLVLFRDHKCQYRGMYTWDQISDTVYKIDGSGPKICREDAMVLMFKYDSGAKLFNQIPTRHLSATIDGFTIDEQFWQKTRIPHS